jgi:hypothetical protein
MTSVSLDLLIRESGFPGGPPQLWFLRQHGHHQQKEKKLHISML